MNARATPASAIAAIPAGANSSATSSEARCLLLIFETERPFRGIELRTLAKIVPDEGARSRLAIASRYLGSAAGRAYADVARRPPGFVLRLPLSAARGWDLSDKVG